MYLRVDTAVECSSSSFDYQLLVVLTLPLIFVYQMIPVMYWWVEYKVLLLTPSRYPATSPHHQLDDPSNLTTLDPHHHLRYALEHNRAKLDPPMQDSVRAYEKRAKDRSVAHLRFLFSDYRTSWFK